MTELARLWSNKHIIINSIQADTGWLLSIKRAVERIPWWKERLEHTTKNQERYCEHRDIWWALFRERDLVPIENTKGEPGSRFSWAGAGRSHLKLRSKDPSGIPGLSPRQDIWFVGLGVLCFVCGVSNLAPIRQETDFSHGFLYTARFGRTNAVGRANSHKFLGNNSWWLKKKAIKQPGGRDRRKQWQRTMYGITTECQDKPHGSFSWLAPLRGRWLCQTRSPVSREGEGVLTSQTLPLPLLWFIHQIVTETSFAEGTIRSLPRTNRPSPCLVQLTYWSSLRSHLLEGRNSN